MRRYCFLTSSFNVEVRTHRRLLGRFQRMARAICGSVRSFKEDNVKKRDPQFRNVQALKYIISRHPGFLKKLLQ